MKTQIFDTTEEKKFQLFIGHNAVRFEQDGVEYEALCQNPFLVRRVDTLEVIVELDVSEELEKAIEELNKYLAK